MSPTLLHLSLNSLVTATLVVAVAWLGWDRCHGGGRPSPFPSPAPVAAPPIIPPAHPGLDSAARALILRTWARSPRHAAARLRAGKVKDLTQAELVSVFSGDPSDAEAIVMAELVRKSGLPLADALELAAQSIEGAVRP